MQSTTKATNNFSMSRSIKLYCIVLQCRPVNVSTVRQMSLCATCVGWRTGRALAVTNDLRASLVHDRRTSRGIVSNTPPVLPR